MREVTVSTTISAPREDIFDFVCDLAARPAYTDHFMDDYRLARVQPVGVGAAARFRLDAPLANEYAELTITKADRPRQIIEEIRVGRRGRSRSVAVYDFTRESAGVTRVELTTFSEPATMVDRFRQFGAAGWIRRKTNKSLDRLRMIFEEPQRVPPKRVDHRGLRAGEGRALRRARRHGPGSPVEALTARANMPARMPRRLVMLLCLAALAGGRRRAATPTWSRAWRSPRARGSPSSSTAWSTTSSSRAS